MTNEHFDVDRVVRGGHRGERGGADSTSRMCDQHLHLPVGCRRRDGDRLAGQRQILPKHSHEVVDHRTRSEDVDVAVHSRVGAPVDAADDGTSAVNDQQLHVVDRQVVEREGHHADAALLELGPDTRTAALRGILDRGDRHAPVVGVEQHTGQVEPLEFVELEVDRASRGSQDVHDGCKRGRTVGQGSQLVASADDRDSDPGWRGKEGSCGGGTARYTRGDQQRQEEEGQPEAGRAVHWAILPRICISVHDNTGLVDGGVAV